MTCPDIEALRFSTGSLGFDKVLGSGVEGEVDRFWVIGASKKGEF
jgi:hypothetical protein